MITTQPPAKAYLTLREAAQYANCSTMTIRRAVKSHALLHHRHGFGEKGKPGKIFISAKDLDAYLSSRREL